MSTRKRSYLLLLLAPIVGLLAWYFASSKEKSTSELIADLKSTQEKDRIIAVRLLPGRKQDAAQAVPALIEALNDEDSGVRRSAAIGLGDLGDMAKEAITALQTAKADRDVRVREAAAMALHRIDPATFGLPVPRKPQ